MSREGIKAAIKRMVADEEFRATVVRDPAGTLKAGGFDLTAKEVEAFKQLQAEDLTTLSPEELEERLAKVIVVGVAT